MPTTKLKNAVYRAILPFCAPRCGPRSVSGVAGRPFCRRRDFERLIRRHHVLGSSTLLASGDQVLQIYTDSVSPAHHAGDGTMFRVASITKTATAVLAMRLVSRHLISLDQPVGGYFESTEAGKALDGITLRHLLSHTAGLVDPPDLELSLEQGRPFSEIVPSARKSRPGQSFLYSNLGFGLIGCIFESVTSRPVSQVFAEELFLPLGMNATLEGCSLDRGAIMPVTRILPYCGGGLVLTPLGEKPLSTVEPLLHYGHSAGSMYTDAASLLKLILVLASGGGSFLPESLAAEMLKKQASYGMRSPTLSYGLGLLRIDDPTISDGVVYGHQGFAYGCADGAFWEDKTGRVMITLNGGCSEARTGRLGLANRDFLRWAFRKEMPAWQ